MTFNLKQKLKDGKDATVKAFTKAVDGGNKLAGKVEAKLTAIEHTVGEKVHNLRKKKTEPKNDGPKA
jgi:hypothetical protein